MFAELDECDTRRRQRRRRRLCTACSSSGSFATSHDAVYPQLPQRQCYSRHKIPFASRHGASGCARRRWQRPECLVRTYSSPWKTTLFLLWAAMVSYSRADDTSSSLSPLNVVTTQNYCKHHLITVSSLSILCDTPGAYYSGSNAYRNSPVCVSNDKAKLDIICKFLRAVRATELRLGQHTTGCLLLAFCYTSGSCLNAEKHVLLGLIGGFSLLRNLTLALRF
jgi:hypothetical protein